MKTQSLLSLASLVLAVQLPAASNPKIYVNIVGDVFAPGYVAPKPDQPAYYVLYDAGFIERGDPVANDNPPPAADVTRALSQYLPASNFLPASAAHGPTLLLVAHWGVMRNDTMEISPPFEIRPSLRARIRLVSTPDIAQRIERELTDRIYRRELRSNIAWPRMLSNTDQDALDVARDDHYFVIVTAYDYAAALKKQISPVWRVKLSTYTRRTSMADALPSLIRNGRTYFGRSTPEPVNDRMLLRPETEVKLGELQILGEAPPPAEIAPSVLDTIRQAESSALSGAKAEPADETKAAVPAALNNRLEKYRAEKLALQNELKTQLERAAPGADTTRTVENFNRAHADRIAALNRELESIRSELARLAAANTEPGKGKSIQALRDEFATANY